MDFKLNEEQLAFAEAIEDVVNGAGGTAVARAWGEGNPQPGVALWRQFAELGLLGLRVPESSGGMSGSVADLAVVCEKLGYLAVPGPYVESLALLPGLVNTEQLGQIASGAIATTAVTNVHPFALDADVSDYCFAVSSHSISSASAGHAVESISPMRHLFHVDATGSANALDRQLLSRALDEATIANASMLIGAGERLLHEAIEYAKIREQFGRAIGEYQSLKHQLADVRIALSFARPLLWQAALGVEQQLPTSGRDTSAAKVSAARAAQLAARASLQVHGAIGYTAEYDLSLWLNWVPALVGLWGSPSFHRDRIARSVLK